MVKDVDYEVGIDRDIEEMQKKKKELEKMVEKLNYDLNSENKPHEQVLTSKWMEMTKN